MKWAEASCYAPFQHTLPEQHQARPESLLQRVVLPPVSSLICSEGLTWLHWLCCSAAALALCLESNCIHHYQSCAIPLKE